MFLPRAHALDLDADPCSDAGQRQAVSFRWRSVHLAESSTLWLMGGLEYSKSWVGSFARYFSRGFSGWLDETQEVTKVFSRYLSWEEESSCDQVVSRPGIDLGEPLPLLLPNFPFP